MLVDVDAEVVENARLSPDYNVIALGAAAIAAVSRPGQFVMVKPQAGLDPLLRRPFSIFEIRRDAGGRPTGLTLLNKRVGAGTTLLYEAKPGDRVGCFGPLGQPFVPVDPPAHAWMVAGGVGLAPFVTLAEALATRKTATTLFYGARSAADLYGLPAFEQLGVRLVLTTEDGTRGEKGRVTVPLERELRARPEADAVTIYACGPTPMMRAVAALADRARRPTFVSLEPVMGCGLGGCYSCVVPIRRGAGQHFVRSCIEGPVFDARTLIWDGLSDPHAGSKDPAAITQSSPASIASRG
jgi:dihydroorotate dehydrogenase electron transfer subunit